LVPTDGTLKTKWQFKHDNQGNRVEDIGDRDDGSRTKVLYKYDKGKVVEKISYADDQFVSHSVYIRDNRGNIIERIDYKPSGSIAGRESYKYEFDSTG